MVYIKKYGYIVNKQFKVNKERNISTIVGIILSIILFMISGYIQHYYKQVDLFREQERTGKYEIIVKHISNEDIEKLSNNVLVDKVGICGLLHSSKANDNELNIKVYGVDDIVLNEFLPISQLEDGNLPKNQNEIIIEKSNTKNLNKDIGDIITIDDTSYKIVGFYNKLNTPDIDGIECVTYQKDINDLKNINAAFNVKTEKNKAKDIEKVLGDLNIKYRDSNNDKIIVNAYLLNFYGGAGDLSNSVDFTIENTNFILFLAILILSIILTYNSINISIRERINQFSILRCIGASTSKIKILLIKESFLLALYSIILGIILGQLICYFIIANVLNKLVNIEKYKIPYEINFELIGLVILLSIVNISISTIIPILKVGKIPPIEGIKNRGYNDKKIKKSNSKKIRKLLGYDAEIAYKNIRGNYREFFVTTITSITLLTTFIIFSGYIKNIYENLVQEDAIKRDVSLNINLDYENEHINTLDILKYHEENIKNLGTAENVFASKNYHITGIFKDLQFNKYIKNNYNGNFNGYVNTTVDNEKIAYSDSIHLVIMNDKFLEKTLPNLEDKDLSKEDFKENGVLISNTVVLKNLIDASRESWFNLKKGDQFSLAIKDSENSGFKVDLEKDIKYILKNSKEVKFKYLGDIDVDTVINGDGFGYSQRPTLFVSEDFYNNNMDLFINDNGEPYLTSTGIYMSMDLKPNINREYAYKTIKDYSNKFQMYIADNKYENLYFINNVVVLSRIVNLVMFLTIIIGATIMINNKIININLRGKEIGTLLAIGISKKRIKKIFIFESLIQWAISSSISLLLSYTILKIMYELLIYSASIYEGKMPIFEMTLGCSILLIINIVGSYLPIRKLKYVNTTELIRNNE